MSDNYSVRQHRLSILAALVFALLLFCGSQTGNAAAVSYPGYNWGLSPQYELLDDPNGGDCQLIGVWDGASATCTLTADITSIDPENNVLIYIASDGITLDGDHHTVGLPDNDFYWNILIEGRTGVTVRDVSLMSGNSGIRLEGSSGNTVTANESVYAGSHPSGPEWPPIDGGVVLNNSTDNNVSGNSFRYNAHAIFITGLSGGNTIDGNIGLESPIRVESAGGDSLHGNVLTSGNGLTSAGIDIVRGAGNTIAANEVYGGGIILVDSGANDINGNRVSWNADGPGLSIAGGNGNSVADNYSSHNQSGLLLSSTAGNIVTGNTVAGSYFTGIGLIASTGNALSGNSITGTISNSRDFYFEGATDADWDNTVEFSNTISGNGIWFGRNVSGSLENDSPGVGAFYCSDCPGFTLANMSIEGQIVLRRSDSAMVTGNGASSQRTQMTVMDSTGVTVSGNVFDWIGLKDSSGNALRGNQVVGIKLSGSSNNLIDGNARLSGGVWLKHSHSNQIFNNFMGGGFSPLHFDWSNDNLIYRNVFKDDLAPPSFVYGTTNTGNQFSQPAPLGGNYWKFAPGSNHSYSCQNADNDSFCDNAMSFTGGADSLPWAAPYAWDTDAPVIDSVTPGGIFTAPDAIIEVAYSDGSSGIDATGTQVYLDGSLLNGCRVTLAGAACGVYGLSEGTHVISGQIVDRAGNAAAISGGFEARNAGKPSLTLTRSEIYWFSYGDYLRELLTVEFTVTNAGAGDAFAVGVTGGSCTDGVIIATGLPLQLGDLPVGAEAVARVEFRVPAGVNRFQVSLQGAALDGGGRQLSYPYAVSRS